VELRQLEYFAEVAELLNFGRAAERLHVGQPAVSQQIRRLERELGQELFDRSSRTVRLTEAGQRLLPEARAALAAVERARARSTASPHRGSCVWHEHRVGRAARAGAGGDAATGPGRARRAGQCLDASPARAVRAGQLDATFVRGATAVTGLELIPVWRDQLVAALPARHELAAQDEVAVERLRELPLKIARRRDNRRSWI